MSIKNFIMKRYCCIISLFIFISYLHVYAKDNKIDIESVVIKKVIKEFSKDKVSERSIGAYIEFTQFEFDNNKQKLIYTVFITPVITSIAYMNEGFLISTDVFSSGKNFKLPTDYIEVDNKLYFWYNPNMEVNAEIINKLIEYNCLSDICFYPNRFFKKMNYYYECSIAHKNKVNISKIELY